MQAQTIEQTLFNFLILGKSRFPPKKVLLHQLLIWYNLYQIIFSRSLLLQDFLSLFGARVVNELLPDQLKQKVEKMKNKKSTKILLPKSVDP